MPAWSITPAEDFPPPASGFNAGTQFQANGTNVGIPQPALVNFQQGTGVAVTSSVDANGNPTIDIAASGSSGFPIAVCPFGSVTGNGADNPVSVPWATPYLTNADVTFPAGAGAVTFVATGLYRVRFVFSAGPDVEDLWPTGVSQIAAWLSNPDASMTINRGSGTMQGGNNAEYQNVSPTVGRTGAVQAEFEFLVATSAASQMVTFGVGCPGNGTIGGGTTTVASGYVTVEKIG